MTRLEQRPVVIAGFLAVAVIAVYSSIVGLGFIFFDDPAYVFDNPRIFCGVNWDSILWAFTHSHASNWHPLTSISHMLDCDVFGLNPGGHHLGNMALHAANTVLLWLLLRRITGSTWRSAFVAAAFALHPLRVESVAWVSERKDVLSLFFGLAALYAYTSYVESSGGTGVQNRFVFGPPSLRSYALALLLFACGLMSKPMLVTMPLLMLLLDIWPLKRVAVGHWRAQTGEGDREAISKSPADSWRVVLLDKIPFVVLSGASCIITFVVQRAGGAVAGLQQLPLGARVGNALMSYVRYLGKLFWPTDLAVIYPFQHWPVYAVIASFVILSCISLFVLWQSPRRPYLFVGWAWYVVSLLPVIGIVQVGAQSIADRYTYLPSIGILVALTWGMAEIVNRLHLKSGMVTVGAGSCLALLALFTHLQVAYWKNTETLFQHAISVTSRNSLAYNTLGRYFAASGDYAKAEEAYLTALKIDPFFQHAWNNLGCVLNDQGRFVEALTNCQRAIELGPSFAEAHNNLGTALLGLRRSAEAITAFKQALELRPDYPEAQYNLGNAFAAQGQTVMAREHYSFAVKLNPSFASAHSNYGFMLLKEQTFADAVRAFRAALRLDPSLWQAHFGLGEALKGLGQYAEAAAEFAEVVKTRPDDPIARERLEFCQKQ